MAKKEKTPPPPPAPEAESGGKAPEEAAPKKKSKLKLILLVAAAMVLGGGVAAGVMIFLGGGSSEPPAEQAAAVPGDDTDLPIEAPRRSGSDPLPPPSGDGHGGEAEEAVAIGPENIEFKPFIANLGDGGGKRFLKLTMSVEADTPQLAAEINQKMPQIRDIILMLLTSLSYDDISTLDGKLRLRGQMLNRINTQLSSGKIRNIYFSEFVVQ